MMAESLVLRIWSECVPRHATCDSHSQWKGGYYDTITLSSCPRQQCWQNRGLSCKYSFFKYIESEWIWSSSRYTLCGTLGSTLGGILAEPIWLHRCCFGSLLWLILLSPLHSESATVWNRIQTGCTQFPFQEAENRRLTSLSVLFFSSRLTSNSREASLQ